MERTTQLVAVPNNQTSRLQRRKQQLMRVKRNRVGPAAGNETILHLSAEDEQRSVCAVNVEPQALARTQIGYVIDRIDRAGVHGTSRRNYTERSRAGPAVFFNGLL